ncbi:SusC/RagA family TonB-linked outer membrane protein [Puia dinghuensis]|nr:SusC/RagA family TonB-linked outer membrane protein [Puia dinghuensis]
MPFPPLHLRLFLLLALVFGAMLPVTAQQRPVQGEVLDADTRNPLPLATITTSTKSGPPATKLTDSRGRFSITAVAGATITVSYSGYKTKQIALRDGSDSITVLLERGDSKLDQVVVIGYGKEKRTDLTSSISSISSDQVNELPVTNLASALASRVPGVEVHSTGYAPGSGNVINVRGLNSITQSEGPLYVVDGVAITGDIRDINPADIESVEVLKDAAAAGIYGSRASAGVIIVTTKRARAGTATIDFSMYSGIQRMNNPYHMLDAADFAQLRRFAFNDADPVTYPIGSAAADAKIFNPYELQSIAAGYKSYDWLKAVTRRNAPMQNYSIGVSNGVGKSRVYFSANYLNQAGIIANTGFTRYGGHFSIETDINKIFRLGGNINVNHNFTKGVSTSVYQQALTQSPLMPIYDSTGAPLVITDKSTGTLTIRNPVTSDLYSVNNYTSNRTFGNFYLELTPIRNLVLRSSIGADLLDGENDTYYPRNTGEGFASNGWAEVYNTKSTDVLWENTATYSWTKGDHDLNVLAGATYERREDIAMDMQGKEFPTDLLTFKNMGSAGIKVQDNTNYDGWIVESLLARAIYKFKHRYIINLTGRRDGSSRFGPDNRFGFFPSASAAWRVIEEPWIGYKMKTVLSDWKIRGSYGIIGNQNLPYDAIYTRYNNAQYPFNGSNAVSGYQVGGTAGNPALEWERQHQTNVGMDIAAWNNRLSLSVDYYNKNISSLLMPFNLAPSSGFYNEQVNVAAMNTKGMDINFQATPVKTPHFQWQFTVNWSRYESKITKLFPGRDSVSLSLRVGQPPSGVLVNYVYNGLYQQNDDFTLNPGGKPGDIKIKDLNHDGKITPLDQTIVGHNIPQGWGGFWNYFWYRGISLAVLASYEYGQQLNNLPYTNLTYYNSDFGNIGNVTREGGNYWTPTNTHTNIPRPNAFATELKPLPGGPDQGSSYSIQKGDYIRIKSITLGYDIPGRLIQKAKLRSLNIYVQAIEPFLITSYKGLDPDNGNPTQLENYPRYRTFLAGIKLGL